MNEDTRFFRIVAQLAESYRQTSGQPLLPEGCRDYVIEVLEGLIVNATVLGYYIARLRMMEPEVPGLNETYILEENEHEAILDGRWEDIEDATLGTLVLRPRALRSIARRVGEEPSYHWLKVYDREEEREAVVLNSGDTIETKSELNDYELVELVDIAGDNAAALQQLKGGIRAVLQRVIDRRNAGGIPGATDSVVGTSARIESAIRWPTEHLRETYDWVAEGAELAPPQCGLLFNTIMEEFKDLLSELARKLEVEMIAAEGVRTVTNGGEVTTKQKKDLTGDSLELKESLDHARSNETGLVEVLRLAKTNSGAASLLTSLTRTAVQLSIENKRKTGEQVATTPSEVFVEAACNSLAPNIESLTTEAKELLWATTAQQCKAVLENVGSDESVDEESVDSDETTGAKKTTTTRATKDSERIHQAGDDLRAKFTLPWQLAIAASLLLVGGMIGYLAHPGGFNEGQTVIAQASAEASFRPTRGTDDPVPHIRITSRFAGYAVVVSLADGRRPIVVPYVGADDIEVPLDDTTFHPLPDDTKSAVFVVTPTPAGEVIRRIESTTMQGLESGQEDAVRNAVQLQLESKGYRRMAFGQAQFDNP